MSDRNKKGRPYWTSLFSVLQKMRLQNENHLDLTLPTLIFSYYLLTWNLVSPSLKKALICLAAAIPALMFASAVCAPIFFGVEK